jgi:hypothetical protein
MTCSRCGAPLTAGWSSCPNCGLHFAQPVPSIQGRKGSTGILLVIVGLALAFVVGGGIIAVVAMKFAGSKGSSTRTNSASPADNDSVRIIDIKGLGKREVGMVDEIGYVVYSHKRMKSINSDLLNSSAHGMFVVVNLVVMNESTDKRTETSSTIKLVDDKGKEFAPSKEGTEAALAAGITGADAVLEPVKPDDQKIIALVYDVPAVDQQFKLKIPPGLASLDDEATIKVY